MCLEPLHQLLPSGFHLDGYLDRPILRVPGMVVQIGTTFEKSLCGSELPAMAGLPEGFVNLVAGGCRVRGEYFFKPVRWPSAAACQSLLTAAPASTRRRATCQHP